jgi:hypothetical protein
MEQVAQEAKIAKAKQLARITFDASLGLANRSSSEWQLQVARSFGA